MAGTSAQAPVFESDRMKRASQAYSHNPKPRAPIRLPEQPQFSFQSYRQECVSIFLYPQVKTTVGTTKNPQFVVPTQLGPQNKQWGISKTRNF